MSKQLLLYQSATPVTVQRHARWSVEVGADFRFAQQVNSVPLMAVEFGPASAEYPIVFTKSDEAYLPSVILGLRNEENLYIKDTHWDAKYVPAFIRRYPFVFALSEDKKTFTLCIDESFSGFNQDGRGPRLFGEDGKPSAYVNDQLKFLQEFENQSNLTRSFCRNLDELDLLEPMHAQVVSPAGETSALTGFFCISRDKLKAVSGKTLARLAASDELELVYSHLISLRNFQDLNLRMSGKKS